MKKGLLFIIILIIIGGIYFLYKDFNVKKDITDNSKIILETKKETEEKKQKIWKDDNQIKVGLYKYYGRGQNRKLISEYNDNWSYHNDISSFEVFYTNEDEIEGKTFQRIFKEIYDKYDNIENYKIGYEISFKTINEEFTKTILSPNDTLEYFDYIETYLYDDFHREIGVWYSHTTEEEMNDTTLLTSIKLTAGKKIEEVISDIYLTTFTYENEDDFENNKYRGISKYSIIIKKIN